MVNAEALAQVMETERIAFQGGVPDSVCKLFRGAYEDLIKPTPSQLNSPSRLEALAAGARIKLGDLGVTLASDTACNSLATISSGVIGRN